MNVRAEHPYTVIYLDGFGDEQFIPCHNWLEAINKYLDLLLTTEDVLIQDEETEQQFYENIWQ